MATTIDSALFSWSDVEQFPQLKNCNSLWMYCPARHWSTNSLNNAAAAATTTRSKPCSEHWLQALCYSTPRQPIFCATCNPLFTAKMTCE